MLTMKKSDNESTILKILNTLVKTDENPDEIAGGPKKPFCSEASDAISCYIYTGLQGAQS